MYNTEYTCKCFILFIIKNKRKYINLKNCVMDFNESIALKLISEMKKPGRECLYDLSNKNYKNNHIKQGVWLTIATSIGMGSKLNFVNEY